MSKGSQKQKDAQPKARGASNSSERRSQMKELIDALEESNARGFSSKGVTPPSCTFGDERWTTWILSLSEGADLIASATNYDRTKLQSGLSFRGVEFASVAESLARPLRTEGVAGWYHSVCRVCSKSGIMTGAPSCGWHVCAGPPVDPDDARMDEDTDLPRAAVPTPLVPATTTASKISSISILASVVDSSASEDARMDEDAAPPSAAVPTPLVPATTTVFSQAAFEATEMFYVTDLLELYPDDFGELMWMEDGSCRDGWSVESAYDILAANSDKISDYCSLEQLSLVGPKLGLVYTYLDAVSNAERAYDGLEQPHSTTKKGPKPKEYVGSKFPLGRKETSKLELEDAWKLHQAEDLLFKLLGGRVETVGYGGGGTETSIFGDTSFWNDTMRIKPLKKALEEFAKKKAAKESMQSSKTTDPTSNLAPSMSGFQPSSSRSSPAFSFPSSVAPNPNTDPIATAPSRTQSDSPAPALPSTRISKNRADFVPGTLALRICPGDNNGRCNALSMVSSSSGFAHQPKDVNGAVHTLHNEGKKSSAQSKMKLVGVFEEFLDLPRLLIRFLHFASWNFDAADPSGVPHAAYKKVQDGIEEEYEVSMPMSSWSKRSISE